MNKNIVPIRPKGEGSVLRCFSTKLQYQIVGKLISDLIRNKKNCLLITTSCPVELVEQVSSFGYHIKPFLLKRKLQILEYIESEGKYFFSTTYREIFSELEEVKKSFDAHIIIVDFDAMIRSSIEGVTVKQFESFYSVSNELIADATLLYTPLNWYEEDEFDMTVTSTMKGTKNLRGFSSYLKTGDSDPFARSYA